MPDAGNTQAFLCNAKSGIDTIVVSIVSHSASVLYMYWVTFVYGEVTS